LIGEIPLELITLRNLEVLSLYSNCLFGTLPSEMGSMTNLQQLDFEENGLGGYVPDELFNMSSLTHLNLAWQTERNCNSSSGELVSIYTDGLEGYNMLEKILSLRHLKEVFIEGNWFSGEIPPQIKNMKQLGENQPLCFTFMSVH
jgi:hypothetical protein